MTLEQDGATCLLLGSFISLDILACASTRSTPILEIDHIQVLTRLGITTGRIIGCQNSVMALIYEIILLENWKVESQANHTLSIVELAKRGTHIEHRLRQQLANLDSTKSIPQRASFSPMVQSIPSQITATKAYALAAIAYLHIVISGPHPELPEIARAVSDAVTLFRSAQDDPKLLLNIIWPLCVVGSMVIESQQTFFRQLPAFFAQNTADGGSLPLKSTLLEALKIMEQCWHARKTLQVDCDWASIMDQTNCHVLLR